MAVEAARIRRIRRRSGAGQLFWSGPRRRPNAWYVAVPGTWWPAHSLPRNWSAGLRPGDRCFHRGGSGGLKAGGQTDRTCSMLALARSIAGADPLWCQCRGAMLMATDMSHVDATVRVLIV